MARLVLGRRLALAGHHTDMIAERRQITNWPCTGWPKNYTFSSDHNTAVCLKRLRRYVEFRMFGSSGLPVTCAVHLGHPVDTKRFGASGCIYSHLQFLVYYYYYIVLCLWCDAMKKLPSYKIYGVHGSARSPYLTEVTTCDQLRSIFIHATRILSYSVWGVVHNRRNTENKLFARSMQHCRT